MLNDAHGQIRALMPVAPAVEYPLGCVPYGPAHDRFMMVGLEVLVFLALVLFLLMISELGLGNTFVCNVNL